MRKKLEGFSFDGLTFTVSYANYFFKNVNFINCNLSYDLFTAATLDTVTFDRCNLQLSNFNNASLINVKFINCNLNQMQFEEATLKTVTFKQIRTLQNSEDSEDSNMENANFYNAKIVNSRFRNINLTNSTFDISSHVGTKFIRGTLQKANLQGTDWINCEWRSTTLYHTNLSNIHFIGHTFDNIDFRCSKMHEIVLADNKQAVSKKYLTFDTKHTVIKNTFFGNTQSKFLKVKADNLRQTFKPDYLTIFNIYFFLKNLLANQKNPVLMIMVMLQQLATEDMPNNVGKNVFDVVFTYDYCMHLKTDDTQPVLPAFDSQKNMIPSVVAHDTWKSAGRHEKLLLIQQMFLRIKPYKDSSGVPSPIEKRVRDQLDQLKDLYVRLAKKFQDCPFVRYQVAKDANSKRSIINFSTGWGLRETSTYKTLEKIFKADIEEYANDIHPLLRLR